ncbi:unnamed protein product [Cuscuta campestris]|uniref:Uncharacterized protein n=1 Tax=Cuscuta campestris TaxID=132261 RepID=A0A484MWM6_9ASTE|nr:unnamed protein product [Cuscuta campestris]
MKLPSIPAAAALDGFINNLQYEPKSVLELLPSADDHLDDDHHFLPANFHDWDSLMMMTKPPLAAGNSTDPLLFTPPPPENATDYFFAAAGYYDTSIIGSNLLDEDGDNDNKKCCSSWRYEYDYVDELIQLADCFDSFQPPHQLLLAQLHHKLPSPAGKPLRRAAFYFKEALQSGGCRASTTPSDDVIKSIEAYQIFSSISPVPMFSGFTANQAMLEAVVMHDDDEGSAVFLHAIDFDIGFGSHWASFMKELVADRGSECPVLRITAVVPDGFGVESKLIKDNLAQLATELSIDFHVDFVLLSTFRLLSFEAVKFLDGERVLVLLSPAIFRVVEASYFAADLRRISPEMVVSVDCDGIVGCGPSSVRQKVIDGLMFYSTLLESLEAASAGWGGDWMERVENFVVVPKIEEMVGAAESGGTAWKEAFAAAGFRQVGLSQFADLQANCLVGRMQIGGFHVAKRHEEMLLCWQDRALVSTSAWK